MDPTIEIEEDKPILMFDGVCNLCNSAVNFVLDHDHDQRIVFASLQSGAASRLLNAHGLDSDYLKSIVFIHKSRVYQKSRAALEVLRVMGFPWNVSYLFIIIPDFVRDFIYDQIAKNRYRWFGKRAACRIPTPELKERFLDS